MAASLEVGGWRAELDGLLARFGRLFVRAEPRGQAGRYLEGLLGPVERKNGWQLAEHLGDARPWRTQRLLSHVLWDEEAARDLCRDHAVERLGAAGAVLGVDETGFLKKGRHSAGGAREYSGPAGEGPPRGRRGAAVQRHRGEGRELPGRGLPGLRQPQGAGPDRPRAVPAGG